MKLWRRRVPQDAPRPQGLRIVRRDGTTVACGVLRHPAGDKDGMACWRAFPLEDGYRFDPSDTLECDVLPGNTGVELALRLPQAGQAP